MNAIRLFRKGILFLVIFGMLGNFGFGQGLKNQMSIFGGLSRVLEYGSEEDYVMGKNDFPVTPSHTPPFFGLSLTRFFFNSLGFELDVRYHAGSKLTLEDPSDGDRVEMDSTQHLSLIGSIVYRIQGQRLHPFFLLGAGFDFLSGAKDQILTTEYGYEVAFAAPEKKSDFVINAGGGIQYFLGSRLGVRLDLRYVAILKTDEHPTISSVDLVVGIVYQF